MANSTPSAKIEWHGTEFLEKFRQAWMKRLYLAAAHVQAKIQSNISRASRDGGRSKAGEYPKADTGRLRQSIFFEVDTQHMTAVVGTPLEYGLMLEYGTRSARTIVPKKGKVLSWVDGSGIRRYARRVTIPPLAPRPYLRRTMLEEAPTIRRFFEKYTGNVSFV